MGFLSALRNLLADKSHAEASEDKLRHFRDAWGLEADEGGVAEGVSSGGLGPDAQSASEYDKVQWRRKLQHIFQTDPVGSAEWPALLREGKALNLGDDWIAQGMTEEFTMLIRSLIADRRLSEDDQARLDAVRKRIGWSEEEAAAVVHSVVADARRFFGGDVVIEHG